MRSGGTAAGDDVWQSDDGGELSPASAELKPLSVNAIGATFANPRQSEPVSFLEGIKSFDKRKFTSTAL